MEVAVILYIIHLFLVYDASAKIPPGLITGNIKQLGNYDECLRIKTGQSFNAQACSASVRFAILEGKRRSLELDLKDLLIQVSKASVSHHYSFFTHAFVMIKYKLFPSFSPIYAIRRLP